jgi:hypothetical protein
MNMKSLIIVCIVHCGWCPKLGVFTIQIMGRSHAKTDRQLLF